MKKLTALLLLLCLVFGLASCVSDGGESSSATESSKAAESSETVEASKVVESSEVIESSETVESPDPINKSPERVIYSDRPLTSCELDGHFAPDGQKYRLPNGDEGFETVLEEYKTDNETYFLVALYPEMYKACTDELEIGRFVDGNELESVFGRSLDYLLDIGFIPANDHKINTTPDPSVKDYNCAYIVGYMTADMILSLDDPNMAYLVFHLPTEEDWERVWLSCERLMILNPYEEGVD